MSLRGLRIWSLRRGSPAGSETPDSWFLPAGEGTGMCRSRELQGRAGGCHPELAAVGLGLRLIVLSLHAGKATYPLEDWVK